MSRTINCCILGDSNTGKTCMVESYTSDAFPRIYKPTVLDVYSALVNVGDDSITLRIFDLSGSKEGTSYRKELVKNCDVAILCFSLIHPPTLKSIKKFWVPEIRECNASIPIVLVGTHSDLASHQGSHFKAADYQAKLLESKLGLDACMECSALTQNGLKKVFDKAIFLSLKSDEDPENSKNKKCNII